MRKLVVFDESYPTITEDFIDDMFSKNESKDSDFAVKFYKRKMDAPFFKEMNRSIKINTNEWNHYDLNIINEITDGRSVKSLFKYPAYEEYCELLNKVLTYKRNAGDVMADMHANLNIAYTK